MATLNEGLEYMDLKEQMSNKLTVDEYAAKMGKDNEIVTITFEVYSKLAAEDLTAWFERGYDFVLDASVSKGELEPGKYLVFVEMLRRTKVPYNLVRLLSDLQTLTDYDLNDWIVSINEIDYPAEEEVLLKNMITNPGVYLEKVEAEKEKIENKDLDSDLEGFKTLAGLDVKPSYDEKDEDIRNMKNIAGL